MTHGAATGMKGKNAIRAGPSVGEQWIGASCPTTLMAGFARLGSRKIGSAPQYRMGCRGVLSMAIKVQSMTGDTLSACGLAKGAANQ